MGYGPGVACYAVLGVMAAYSGLLLWHLVQKLESDRFPVRSFGDLGYRIFGNWFRIGTSATSFYKHVTRRSCSVPCFAEFAAHL